MDNMTAAKSAIPKLLISNELPTIASVNRRVIALMTNRKSPKLNIVTGNVKIIRIGRTIPFNNERTKLARIAAVKPSISNPSK